MIRDFVNALEACLLSFILCAVVYPLAVWGIGSMAFPKQASGSLIESHGKVVGSELIAQPFASDKYFKPRPSACDYKGDAASGSNLGTKNPDLQTKIAERAKAFNASESNAIPLDLVTTSGSGLDPDISVEGANYQAARIASARGIATEQVLRLIKDHTNTSGLIIGASPRANVLRLNMDLDNALDGS